MLFNRTLRDTHTISGVSDTALFDGTEYKSSPLTRREQIQLLPNHMLLLSEFGFFHRVGFASNHVFFKLDIASPPELLYPKSSHSFPYGNPL